MISIVVYGRNDSYGYNLHKRAGLSLNCIAATLNDADDEILFVDYNTPDDFPTFPEAIRDTLTPEVRRRLRIFRVRPEIHRRYAERTHLPVIEAIARNVAVRRSNPRNRWVLSTNTDMIFVSREDATLSSIVSDLPRGYYHLPRYDIPESIWETFNRMLPRDTMAAAENLGRTLHLNENVRSEPFFLYDAPGDFQLVERAVLFQIHGFHEKMLLGWHLDANVSKRLYLIYGRVGDLSHALLAYHCNHTRQATPKHSDSKTDDWTKLVEQVKSPELLSQAETWGCPQESIEEISLCSCWGDTYRASLPQIIGPRMAAPSTVHYREESYDRVKYDACHVLPYLSDIFVNYPRDWSIGWFGGELDMLRSFANMWRLLGFSGALMIEACRENRFLQNMITADLPRILQKANVFVFDFGGVSGDGMIDSKPPEYRQKAAKLLHSFWNVIDVEQSRPENLRRRIITINTMNGYLEKLVGEIISGAKTRISTRIRYGVAVNPSHGRQEWLRKMRVGSSGVGTEEGIQTRLGLEGHVFYGPYSALRPGRYNVIVLIQPAKRKRADSSGTVQLVLEVVNRNQLLSKVELSSEALSEKQGTLSFEVEPYSLATAIEVRLWSAGNVDALVTSVAIERIA